MYAVDLLPPNENASDEAADRWLDAALADAAALHNFDGELNPLTGDPASFERAHRFREEWKRWADDASRVYAMTARADAEKRQRLYVELAFARTIVRQSPEEIYRRYKAAEAGDYKTGEEMRRELDLPRRR